MSAEIIRISDYFRRKYPFTFEFSEPKLHRVGLLERIATLIPSRKPDNVLDIQDFIGVVRPKFRARGTLRKIT